MRLCDLSDEGLALRARVEPRAAFGVLFERYRGPIWNFYRRQGVPEAQAEDLFQTTFLKAFRAVASFREEARFKTWLFTIAVNVLHDDRRVVQRRGRPAELRETTAVVESVAHEPVERAEAVERVKEALTTFAPNHRQLFTLVRLHGMKIADAARITGLTPPAAKVTLFRVHKKIGEMLAPVKENL